MYRGHKRYSALELHMKRKTGKRDGAKEREKKRPRREAEVPPRFAQPPPAPQARVRIGNETNRLTMAPTGLFSKAKGAYGNRGNNFQQQRNNEAEARRTGDLSFFWNRPNDHGYDDHQVHEQHNPFPPPKYGTVFNNVIKPKMKPITNAFIRMPTGSLYEFSLNSERPKPATEWQPDYQQPGRSRLPISSVQENLRRRQAVSPVLDYGQHHFRNRQRAEFPMESPPVEDNFPASPPQSFGSESPTPRRQGFDPSKYFEQHEQRNRNFDQDLFSTPESPVVTGIPPSQNIRENLYARLARDRMSYMDNIIPAEQSLTFDLKRERISGFIQRKGIDLTRNYVEDMIRKRHCGQEPPKTRPANDDELDLTDEEFDNEAPFYY